MSSNHRLNHAIIIVLAISALSGCGERQTGSRAPATAAAAPEVSVITVTPALIALTTELPGRLEASRIAQVRARIAGIVLQRPFREGSDVKAGDVLFRIDSAPLQASYESAQAALTKAEASLAQTNLKAQRYKPLVDINAISKQEYDDAASAQKLAAADVALAKATRQTASLNLAYATITAPISGRIGRAQVTEGALVGQGEATPLATIQQLDPMYVNLTQSSTDVMRLRLALTSGKLKNASQDQARVTLTTEDGQVYPHPGKLLFSDLSVDESTGAIALRAEFPNPDRLLLPGMFVRARLQQAVNEQALMVPQQAVLRSPDGASVLLVGADGKVTSQPITTDSAQGNNWIVSQGLKSGDRVIVEGLQKAKPGATVKPIPWKDTAAQARPGSTASSAAAKESGASSDQKPASR